MASLAALQARFNKRIKKKHERKTDSPIIIMPPNEMKGRLGDFKNYGIGRKCPKRRK